MLNEYNHLREEKEEEKRRLRVLPSLAFTVDPSKASRVTLVKLLILPLNLMYRLLVDPT